MAKKGWCCLLEGHFISQRESKDSEPEKVKKRICAFARLKIKRLALVSTPSLSRERPVRETEQHPSKHAVTEASSTAAISMTAAQFAAKVVQLTGIPQSVHQADEESREFSAIQSQANAAHQCKKEIQDLSATRIQTAFRGYLARKALRALRGLVRLQAIIRGRAVRRQAVTTLKCLQSIVDIQSRVRERRFQMVEGTWDFPENKDQLQDFKDEVKKIDTNIQRRWDDSILLKEEANALFLNRRDAAVKRERIREYSFSHRRSAESEWNKVNARWRYWLEHWVDTELSKNSDTVVPSNARTREEIRTQLKPTNCQKQHRVERQDSPLSAPRRSFQHKKHQSFGENNDFASSSFVPTYMAATESAKAKARSMSSPRLTAVNLDAYSETSSPYKHKLSPISSIKSETITGSRIYNISGFQQRSATCLKGIQGRVKPCRSLKDLSFDSDCSLPNWDRNRSFR